MRRLIIASLLAALTGCASMADQLQGRLAPPAGMGYAVFSMTVRTYEPEHASANVYWHGLDNSDNGMVSANFGTDSVFGPEGSPPANGKLQLLTLPAGRYQLARATGNWSDTGSRSWSGFYGMYNRSARFRLDKPFEVKAGETVYLGEIRFNLDNLPDLTLGDARQRDYAHMQRVWKVQNVGDIRPAPYSGTVPRGN